MGKFDKIEQNHAEEFRSVERMGNSRQQDRLPMREENDIQDVRKEFDTVTPDQLLNMCKRDKDGEKRVLQIFYTTVGGRNVWRLVAMPRNWLKMRNHERKRGEFQVVDCRTGKRKVFRRDGVRKVAKHLDGNGRWAKYPKPVDSQTRFGK